MAIITEGIEAGDRERIGAILRSTDFFYDFEIETALGIADETLKKGMQASGYFWVKANINNEMAAFANYGRNDFSTHSWDLYWIAVHQDFRNMKLGSQLLRAVEEKILSAGGKILWIETSGRPLYSSTEEFYRRNGYELQASLKDFYAPGDPKQIYSKVFY
jgi:ribosomal protein S18 acetylase RimI-like enzyme